MTNDELEAAFEQAELAWIAAHPNLGYSSIQHRHFFIAGAEFGIQHAKDIFNRTYGPSGIPAEADLRQYVVRDDDTEGHTETQQ